jgi:hypothetical protein
MGLFTSGFTAVYIGKTCAIHEHIEFQIAEYPWQGI